MKRFLLIFASALSVSACAALEAPFNEPDEPRWFDQRAAEASGRQAPSVVPMIEQDPADADEARRASQNAENARDRVAASDRAAPPGRSDTQDYADDARDRANPDPNP